MRALIGVTVAFVLGAAFPLIHRDMGGAGDGPQLRLATGIGQVGEKVGAELRVDNMPAPGLGAWTITVTFDPLLSVNSCTATQRGGSAFCRVNDDGHSVHLVGANRDGIVGDDVLASISLQCSTEYSLTSSSVSPSIFADATGNGPQPIAVDVFSGQVVCASTGLRGDVDCGGSINAIDATVTLQYAAALLDELPCAENGDPSGDGVSNSLDAALILQYSAGLIEGF